MSLFNSFFGRDTKLNTNDRGSRLSERFSEEVDSQQKPFTTEKKNPIEVFYPKSFSDVENIINYLRGGKNAIVHLTEVKLETAIRILDLLSGAIYALGGGLYEIQKNVFMFSPNGVEVNQ